MAVDLIAHPSIPWKDSKKAVLSEIQLLLRLPASVSLPTVRKQPPGWLALTVDVAPTAKCVGFRCIYCIGKRTRKREPQTIVPERFHEHSLVARMVEHLQRFQSEKIYF